MDWIDGVYFPLCKLFFFLMKIFVFSFEILPETRDTGPCVRPSLKRHGEASLHWEWLVREDLIRATAIP